MPQYKVIAAGFYDGHLYDPEGKRTVLQVDKPFTKKNKMPSWVTDMPKETAAAKKKRELYEQIAKVDAEEEAAKNPATPGTAAAALQEGVSTQKQVAEASSVGDGNDASFLSDDAISKPGGNVETL